MLFPRSFLLSFLIFVAALLSGCASYSGSNLRSGESTLSEVIATMGEPAMWWKEADGSEQLAYPRGPAGTQTFMVFLTPEGRLDRIEGVLDEVYFARIEVGKSTKEDILKLLGPPPPHWITYFPARDELAWEWRFCTVFSTIAYFNVLFDGATGIVRSTLQRPDRGFARGGPVSCGRWRQPDWSQR